MTITAAETKIKVISKEHDKKGNKGVALDTLLRCKTVAAFRTSLAKKEIAARYTSWALKVAQRDNLVKLVA